MTYEKKLGKHLTRLVESGAIAGKLFSKHWIWFEDENGTGWAQPDFFIVQDSAVLIFEAKLTQTDAAKEQLELLYRPLLEFTFKRPAITIQVCKNLVHKDSTLIRNFAELKNKATLHWLGG